MLPSTVLVDAAHAALEDREKALDGLCVDAPDAAVDVLTGAMANNAVLREFSAEPFVVAGIVGH